MSGVKASSLTDPRDFLERCEDAGRRRGFRVERFGRSAGWPLLALTRRRPGRRPRLYLSSGIHGDEPAAPAALLHLLETDSFPVSANLLLVPLLNPEGFRRGTRGNAGGIDLNRDYLRPRTPEIHDHVHWLEAQPPVDLALCLHEDWEAQGFYLYELNPDAQPTLAPTMIAAAAKHLPIDTAAMIDGRSVAETGIIRPEHDPLLRSDWPEAIYLRAHHTRLCYTLETPSAFPFEQRVAALAEASSAAMAAFCAPAR